MRDLGELFGKGQRRGCWVVWRGPGKLLELLVEGASLGAPEHDGRR